MKILVTDGNTLPALAITRSLGRAGHDVVVGHHNASSLAGCSRYTSSTCIYPNPTTHINTFIDYLVDYVEANHIDAIFPVTDITTMSITKNKERLEKYCKIPFADYNIVDNAANKAHVLSLAKSLGIDTPLSFVISSKDKVDINEIKIAYPIVIKPARSRVLTKNGWLMTSVTYATDQTSLLTQLNNLSPDVYPIILQEKIIGSGSGIFMCYNEGLPIAAFSHHRIREKPPSGGVSVLRESIPLDPLAYDFSVKLLSNLQWHGVAMVEFKVDERDERPKLMEINGRFWGSLQLAIHSGVDFPALLANTLTNKPVAAVQSYKYGIKTRWFWGDVDALLIRMLKKTSKQQLPPGAVSRLTYIRNFLSFWERDLYYDVLRFNDIKPWLFESYQWFRNCLR